MAGAYECSRDAGGGPLPIRRARSPLAAGGEKRGQLPEIREGLRAVHDSLGIRTVAWSPLAKAKALFEEEPVRAAAEAHGVSPAQAVLRWHFQLGAVPIPKSTVPDHQVSNADIFGFELSDDEVDAITALGREDGRLFGGDPDEHYEM